MVNHKLVLLKTFKLVLNIKLTEPRSLPFLIGITSILVKINMGISTNEYNYYPLVCRTSIHLKAHIMNKEN